MNALPDSFPCADGGVERSISKNELETHLEQLVEQWVIKAGVERLLVLPPDHTRLFSMAGPITQWLWRRLGDRITVDVMPALGTHVAMSPEQCELMFGDTIPYDRILQHRWRQDVVRLGEISADRILELSGGRFGESMSIEINRRLFEGRYDLILSVGQVVPHEVIGFANYTKNVCIGAGGQELIHKSHFLGAVCGMESIMGRADTPVRQAVDEAFDTFIRPRVNIRFILTVIEESTQGTVLRGLYAGLDAECFRAAADLSRQVNLTFVDDPLPRCVVFLDPREFHSTWLGNKAIYRTRMAMADGGELFVLAPGVKTFGEDKTVDRLIREYGYRGTDAALAAVDADPQVRQNLTAPAHLIHGSSEGRFHITYCPGDGLRQEEVESVGFNYLRYEEAVARFQTESLEDGWHMDRTGLPFYFVRNPGLGLWATRERFGN
jgi:nickel-dependent lactate racemase